MIARHKGVVALVALTMIGAKDCDPWGAWDGNNGKTPPVPVPQHYCTTDPPLGCVAICFFAPLDAPMPMPSLPTPTANCSDPGAGPRAAQFLTDIDTVLTCDQNLYYGASYVVFPTTFYLDPQVTQTGNCTPPPPLPADEPLSAFMGFNQ